MIRRVRWFSITYYVLFFIYLLFFIQLEPRRITLAGIMRRPTAEWVLLMSRNATDKESGHPDGQRYSLHDPDTKFCPASGMYYGARECGRLCYAPPQSPNWNAFAERWVRS
jgi:hypothetical protein